MSAIALVPTMAMTIYRFLFCVPKGGWDSVAFREKYKSHWEMTNFLNWNY